MRLILSRDEPRLLFVEAIGSYDALGLHDFLTEMDQWSAVARFAWRWIKGARLGGQVVLPAQQAPHHGSPADRAAVDVSYDHVAGSQPQKGAGTNSFQRPKKHHCLQAHVSEQVGERLVG
jgi:hypothetical protein